MVLLYVYLKDNKIRSLMTSYSIRITLLLLIM